MINYISRKLRNALLTLFGVVTVIFLLFTVLPGDPAQMMLGQNESSEQIEAINEKYGFDLPIYQQYLLYLNDLSPVSVHDEEPSSITYLSEDKYNAISLFSIAGKTIALKAPYLRRSYQKNGKKVSAVIGETLPNTLLLAFSAIVLAFFIGVFMGVISAVHKDRWIDRALQLISTLGMSVPSFFSSILFAWLFGFVLHEYTNLNMTGSLYELDDLGENYRLRLKNLILPAVVLGIRPLAVVNQLMRNSLLEVLDQDYIRTARMKGLSMTRIIRHHALKNALNPVITALSGWFASMLAGAVFVEYIFGWNGLGKEIVEALKLLDLPVIMGSVIVIATMFIIINIFVDIVYAYLDPKIKT